MHAKIVGYFQFWQCWQETSEEDCSVIPKTSKRREGQKHKAVKTDSVETTKRFKCLQMFICFRKLFIRFKSLNNIKANYAKHARYCEERNNLVSSWD
jgi:hypothetical protein